MAHLARRRERRVPRRGDRAPGDALGSALPLPLLAFYAGGVAAAIVGVRLIPAPGRARGGAGAAGDLPVRRVVATGLVIVITSAAPILGPQLSGLLTTYPVYASALAVFAHAQRGGGRGGAGGARSLPRD